MAGQCAGRLTVVAVPDGNSRDAERAMEQALAAARTQVPGATAEVLHGKPHLALSAAAQRLGTDLIVVGRRGEGGFARAWIGGAAQKVIGLAECPVLVAVAKN